MRKILYSFNTQDYIVLLYDYENRWKNFDTAKWASALNLSLIHIFLVTGLVFDKNMTAEERARIQSEIFDDINSNATKVPRNVLTQIKRIKDPIDDESIAQSVIEALNKEGVFLSLIHILPCIYCICRICTVR